MKTFPIIAFVLLTQASLAKDVVVKLKAPDDVLNHSWAVSVCLYDTANHPNCAEFLDPKGLGTAETKITKTLSLDDNFQLGKCAVGWGGPMQLPDEQSGASAILLPKSMQQGGGVLQHEGICRFDATKSEVLASTPYFFERTTITVRPSAFKNSFVGEIDFSVDGDSYELAGKSFTPSMSDADWTVLVFTNHSNSYSVKATWYSQNTTPNVSELKYQGPKNITMDGTLR